MKSLILYAVDPFYNKTTRFNINEYIPLIFDNPSSPNILIRYEIVDSDVEEALSIAKPREYEIVVNAILIIEDKEKLVDIDIQYFKPSGKYYTHGITRVNKDSSMVDAVSHIKDMFRRGIAPGLTGYEPTFNAYISFDKLANGYPVILQMGQYHE
jgi:hypothetical protein